MTKHRLVRSAVAAITSLSVLVGASPAPAAEHHLQGVFAAFDDCPLSLVSLNTCLLAEMDSGAFTIGGKTVPINAKLALQGGILENEAEELTFIAAEDGNTLSKVALSVPGGLIGVVAAEYLPKTLREAFNGDVKQGLTGVTLTAELARPVSFIEVNISNLFNTQGGVVLQLPVKVKLSNPFLGTNCYIGSSSNPIVLNLSTGTTSPPLPNRPIKGTAGQFFALEESLALFPKASLVDNAFAVAGASGCGGSLSAVIDTAIDAELGIPSRAGRNTAILGSEIEVSAAEDVRKHE